MKLKNILLTISIIPAFIQANETKINLLLSIFAENISFFAYSQNSLGAENFTNSWKKLETLSKEVDDSNLNQRESRIVTDIKKYLEITKSLHLLIYQNKPNKTNWFSLDVTIRKWIKDNKEIRHFFNLMIEKEIEELTENNSDEHDVSTNKIGDKLIPVVLVKKH